jgi:indolepyruvate ferredoxin oxidoreductase alpha subunit
MDVLADAEEILSRARRALRGQCLGSCRSGDAGGLGALPDPRRGHLQGPVGVNVASDALANLSSSGVTGGALVIIGEDYGEGSSIMQERSHAFAMKSQMWLLDPRPNLPSIVQSVHQGFELSEATNTPVMLMVRIRSCHVTGSFQARDNKRPPFSVKDALANPRSDYARVVLPPMSYMQEHDKINNRWPAAQKYIVENKLNEMFGPKEAPVGIVLQGGMYNGVIRALQRLGLADIHGDTEIPLYVLNVTYPLVNDEFLEFCEGKSSVLVVEEGQPEFIEQALGSCFTRPERASALHGKDMLPMAGEYTGQVMLDGLEAFLKKAAPELAARPPARAQQRREAGASRSLQDRSDPSPRILHRLPGTADLRRPENDRAGIRQAPDRRRHRLPPVCQPAAIRNRRFDHGLWSRPGLERGF